MALSWWQTRFGGPASLEFVTMRGDEKRRASTSVGALTRKDRYREAALGKLIDDAYRRTSTTAPGTRGDGISGQPGGTSAPSPPSAVGRKAC